MCSDQSYLEMLNESFIIDDISLSSSFREVDDSVVKDASTTKKKMGKDDQLLDGGGGTSVVMSQETVSFNSVEGTDQNMKTYWKCIVEHFHRNVTISSKRNWCAGCVTQVKCAKPSEEGVNASEYPIWKKGLHLIS